MLARVDNGPTSESGSSRHLDAGEYVAHDGYQLTTQCQISWPTSMAALSGIRARLALEW